MQKPPPQNARASWRAAGRALSRGRSAAFRRIVDAGPAPPPHAHDSLCARTEIRKGVENSRPEYRRRGRTRLLDVRETNENRKTLTQTGTLFHAISSRASDVTQVARTTQQCREAVEMTNANQKRRLRIKQKRKAMP